MIKLDKAQNESNILKHGFIRLCQKKEVQNIVFPEWEDMGLLGMMFRQCVCTKEQPDGHIYDENNYQVVLRILDGKVLISGRPDCYCWKIEKLKQVKNIRDIGINSPGALLSLAYVLHQIEDSREKALISDFFCGLRRDLLLVITPAEMRKCIEITGEMYASGITHCVNQWEEVDEKGLAEATPLSVGDFVIVNDQGIYRIGKEEFNLTHILM